MPGIPPMPGMSIGMPGIPGMSIGMSIGLSIGLSIGIPEGIEWECPPGIPLFAAIVLVCGLGGAGGVGGAWSECEC
jgi:hypothetical protein